MLARSSIIPMLLLALLMALQGRDLQGQNDLLGKSYPEQMSAREEDDFLKVEGRAVLKEEGTSYELEVTITNKTDTMVDILADCGSFVTYAPESPPREDSMCAAVHSMGIRKNDSVTEQYDIPREHVQNGTLTIKVRYEDEGVRGTIELLLKSSASPKI
ncbi:hypothetical protein EHV15_25510 [Paenibacillus oralis]|uniref:DUF4352 domain-containing protein n=1 Tax=Paenibacillus oralis TaxID=2490856 RepID=A0A3P3UBT1_9BACL|nr:hypothetical protein [Paenibacillus oralis]RRJ65903.1 hypothetical protein EHV15_25510 [Paenibacillus oralis]